MPKRGRPQTISNRTGTSISLPQDDLDFINSLGRENSDFIRELIAEKRKSMESPIGKLEREIAEKKKHIEEELFLIQMMENRLAEELDKENDLLRETEEKEEKIRKLKDFIISRFDFIVRHAKPVDFLDYLCRTYGLKDNSEAKQIIFETLVDAGHPIDKVKKINMLKGI